MELNVPVLVANSRAVAKISSRQVYAIRRKGVKELGINFF